MLAHLLSPPHHTAQHPLTLVLRPAGRPPRPQPEGDCCPAETRCCGGGCIDLETAMVVRCTADSCCPLLKPGCFCPTVFDPVCGVDGADYSNSCVAGCSRMKVACKGTCPCKDEPDPEPVDCCLEFEQECCGKGCLPPGAQTLVACGESQCTCDKPPAPVPEPGPGECCGEGFKCCGTGPGGCLPDGTPTLVACTGDDPCQCGAVEPENCCGDDAPVCCSGECITLDDSASRGCLAGAECTAATTENCGGGGGGGGGGEPENCCGGNTSVCCSGDCITLEESASRGCLAGAECTAATTENCGGGGGEPENCCGGNTSVCCSGECITLEESASRGCLAGAECTAATTENCDGGSGGEPVPPDNDCCPKGKHCCGHACLGKHLYKKLKRWCPKNSRCCQDRH